MVYDPKFTFADKQSNEKVKRKPIIYGHTILSADNKQDKKAIDVIASADSIEVRDLLVIAIMELAFSNTCVVRKKEALAELDDRGVVTVGFEGTCDSYKMNFGSDFKPMKIWPDRHFRDEKPYSSAAIAWYSYGDYILRNKGVWGAFNKELVKEILMTYFYDLDVYWQDANKIFNFMNRPYQRGKRLNQRIENLILSDDNAAYRYALEGAKTILNQVIDDAVYELSLTLESDDAWETVANLDKADWDCTQRLGCIAYQKKVVTESANDVEDDVDDDDAEETPKQEVGLDKESLKDVVRELWKELKEAEERLGAAGFPLKQQTVSVDTEDEDCTFEPILTDNESNTKE